MAVATPKVAPSAATKTLITLDAETDAMVIKVPKEGGPCEVLLPSKDGSRGETCFLTPQSLARILDQTLQAGAEDTEGWIDFLGVANPGIAINTRKSSIRLLLSFAERRKTLPYYCPMPPTCRTIGKWEADFLLPPTLWALEYHREAAGGQLQRAGLYASETRITSLGDPTPLVIYPFGNADPRVCWGNVVTTHLRASDPLAADNLFFTSRFNDHLVQLGGFRTPDGEHCEDITEWWKALKANPNKRFPLVIGGRATVASRIKSFFGGGE